MTLSETLATTIENVTGDLIELRRDLHQYPELSWHESRTTDVIAAHMDKLGLRPQRFANGTGLLVDLGPSEGPIVALRADLDALPVHDETTDPWRSKIKGVAHACGHDVHTAALTGAAIALVEAHRAHGLPHGVRLIFQPAEEVMPGGALSVSGSGALQGVSRIFSLHCDPMIDVGQVGLREGPITGASDMIHITLTGRGGHTSRPHRTEDLTFALGTLITQMPAILSRRFDPRAGVSLVWGHVSAGQAANVIPSAGQLSGTVRMLDARAWRDAEAVMRELVAELVAPLGVTATINYQRGVPPVVNDFDATQVMRAAVSTALGAGGVVPTPQSLGGEDFAWYLEHVPGAMGRLGVRTPGGPTYDLHQGNLRIDERATAVAARVLANAAVL